MGRLVLPKESKWKCHRCWGTLGMITLKCFVQLRGFQDLRMIQGRSALLREGWAVRTTGEEPDSNIRVSIQCLSNASYMLGPALRSWEMTCD